jgi:hypothetical protein
MHFKTSPVKGLQELAQAPGSSIVPRVKLAPALALVALAACQRHRGHASAGSATSGSAAALVEPPGLTVMMQGSPPRQLLRYHATTGASIAYELDLDSHLSAGIDAASSMALQMAQTVESAAPGGPMRLRTTVRDAVLHGDGQQPLPTSAVHQVEQMKDMAVVTTIAADGTVQATQVEAGGKDLAAPVMDQLEAVARQLQQVAMTLPAVPLGVGATWQTRYGVDQGGLRLDVISTIQVTAIAGDRITFEDNEEMRAPDQRVTLDGATLDASGIAGTAHGTGTLDLATLAMTRDYEAELHANMAAGSEAATPVTMRVKLKIAPQ